VELLYLCYLMCVGSEGVRGGGSTVSSRVTKVGNDWIGGIAVFVPFCYQSCAGGNPARGWIFRTCTEGVMCWVADFLPVVC
jgi:hypothetical protein